MAVNAAPGSSQPKISPTIRRWALEEIGRNSVSPCTIPRTTASNQLTRSQPLPGTGERTAAGGRGGGGGGVEENRRGHSRARACAPRRGGRRVERASAGRTPSRGQRGGA